MQLADREIKGCISCYKCFENLDGRCAVKKDGANECIEKMTKAQGIILGSPVYFQDVTAEMKALIDRAGFVGLANGKMYKGLRRRQYQLQAACFRRSGGMHTIESMNHLFLSNDVIIAGRVSGMARDKGDMEKDEEGLQIAATLGRRMAWILKKLYG